jgi:hypothetical protein
VSGSDVHHHGLHGQGPALRSSPGEGLHVEERHPEFRDW